MLLCSNSWPVYIYTPRASKPRTHGRATSRHARSGIDLDWIFAGELQISLFPSELVRGLGFEKVPPEKVVVKTIGLRHTVGHPPG